MGSTAVKKMHEFSAANVYSEKKFLCVVLTDGREVRVPLEFYPRLAHATPAQRTNYRLIGRGTGIHWPDVDEDLSRGGHCTGHPEPVLAQIYRQS